VESEEVPAEQLSFPIQQQNLSIEILEGFAAMHQPTEMFGGPDTCLLLKIRITNRIDIPLTTKSWRLQFHHCRDDAYYMTDPAITDIPVSFSYELQGGLGSPIGPEHRIGTRITAHCANSPIRRGKHEEGFLLATCYRDNIHCLFGYSVEIIVVDAEDGTSIGRIDPGDWLKPAIFRFDNPTLLGTVPLIQGPQFQ